MNKEHRRIDIPTNFVSSIAITESIVEYGISSIFILFLMHVLHFSVHLSSSAYSYYYAFAYTLPILVGLISDRYLTKTQSITIGFSSMIISQIMLYLSASMYYSSSFEFTSIVFNLQNTLFIAGLIFLGIGTSFTTNILSKIISLISDKSTSSKIDSYSIYYAFINLGVIFGILIMTFVVGDSNYHLFQKTFLIFAIILIAGLILFLWGKNRFIADYIVDTSEKTHIKENNGNLLKRTITRIKFAGYRITHLRTIQSDHVGSLTKVQKERLQLFFLLLIFIIIYRIGYSQSSASMVIFEENFVIRDYGFLILPVQLFSIFNPLFIILLSPLYSKFNNYVDKTNWDFGIVTRIGIGLLLMAISFIILTTISHEIDIGMMERISIIWIIAYELIIALSELFLSVTGYAMVAKLVPKKYFAYYFGMFQSTHAISRFVTGKTLSLFPLNGPPTHSLRLLPIHGLSSFFMIFAVPSLICGIILLFNRKSLERRVHEGEPN